MTTPTATQTGQMSDKSFLVTILLNFFLGTFGAHRFYLGKTGTAIAMLLTIGGLGVWSLVDLIMNIAGNPTDKAGLPLEKKWSFD